MDQKERKKLKKYLDDLCKKIVKERAMQRVGGCERCLTRKKSISELDWAHCQPRNRLSTRWDIDNAAGFCGGCHIYLDNNHDEKREFFIKLLGEERYELIRMQSLISQKVDYDLIKLYLEQKIK